MTNRTFESAADVAVLVDERLVGLVSIEALLAAPDDARIADIMDENPPVVAPGLDLEVVAWHAVQRSESSLAVLDGDGRFVGLIPPHRLLGVLLSAHDEDIARLGGFLQGTAVARQASEEPVLRRLIHRLPWLLVGLIGAIASAGLVSSFEGQLQSEVRIAFFIPGIVYLADAVGTQTEALVIRGLSIGVTFKQFLRKELATGAVVGTVLAAVFFPIGLLGWGSAEIALAVALALFVACSMATLVALSLPWMFQRLGADPAFGSGPLATVIQDISSIVIYLLICGAIVG